MNAPKWTQQATKSELSQCIADQLEIIDTQQRKINALLEACKYTLAALDGDGWTAPAWLQIHRSESIKMLNSAIAKTEGSI